ncbi:CRISPR-associated protein, Csm2 family [Nitrosococcus halophilus Nc 4]|uniref:CRISPR system Cms protein Csm2 n=1 Tax=Nitrosococcus halophilus (strain Nc4) TaxID=472759 RepID=D5BXY5_NITHN|nr:type III-A CRISPR-associated protein Csm2 [Nitrosococcus halophilus]ADE15896.1 CRISPR-associated protein, Csm2 family [Nitrosococcus halophilus Nc 4]
MSYRPLPHRSSREQGPPRIPKPETQCYFEADGKTPRAALVDEEAEQLAQEMSKVSHTQLRRFYGDVLSLRRRLEAKASKIEKESLFRELLPEFKMLKAKAVYADGRLGHRDFAPLLGFIINHTYSVRRVEEFDAFCKHFQAVVAFHKFYGKKK